MAIKLCKEEKIELYYNLTNWRKYLNFTQCYLLGCRCCRVIFTIFFISTISNLKRVFCTALDVGWGHFEDVFCLVVSVLHLDLHVIAGSNLVWCVPSGWWAGCVADRT